MAVRHKGSRVKCEKHLPVNPLKLHLGGFFYQVHTPLHGSSYLTGLEMARGPVSTEASMFCEEGALGSTVKHKQRPAKHCVDGVGGGAIVGSSVERRLGEVSSQWPSLDFK